MLLVAGCSSSSAENDVRAWIKHDAATWRLSGGGALHSSGTLAASRPADASNDIKPNASCEDYVRLALARNPTIRSAEAKVQGLAERIPQVTSLEDPMLEVTPLGQMAETAAGMVGLMAEVSQKLPFPGKLKARGRLAGTDVAMARQDLEQTKLGVISDTRQAYWTYYFSLRAIEVTQQSRELLAQLRQAAESRYKANLATQQDVLRASVELSDLDNELITLEQRRTTAVAMLNSLLDRPVTAPLPAPGAQSVDQITLDLDILLKQAATANPELAKINARIEGERQRLKLAKLDRWPDLTVGLTYNTVDREGSPMATSGKDQWWVSFGINVPIWEGKLRAGEREAYRGMQEGIAELTAAHNRVAFRVQDAATKAQTQQRLVVLFRDVIVPQAQQAVDASSSGYQAGNVDFLTLVDNWRKLLNFQLMYHQSLAEMEKSYAQLEQEIAHDLPRAPATQPATQSATR